MSEHDELQGQPEIDPTEGAVIEGGEVEEQVTEEAESEQPEAEASESAPDSDSQHEESGELTDYARKAIDRQHKKFRDQQRRAEALAKENAELKAKNNPDPLRDVEIPAIPDPWADDYEAQMRARDEAISRQAEVNARKAEAKRIEQANAKEAERKRLEESELLAEEFHGRSETAGISKKVLADAEKALVDYRVTPEIAEFILTDQDGPAMAVYLAENPLMMEEIFNDTPVRAILKLEREVRKRATAVKRKSTATPAPAETLNGKGVVPKSDLDKMFPDAVIE